MRRMLLIVSTGLCSALLVVPAWAQFAQPNPMSMKYRDAGAKPVGGRSGSAAIEVRALRDAAASTELEVTTGQFDGAAPRGTLAKVQVKLLTDSGDTMQTDNYRRTLLGDGYAAFTYDDLRRGQLVQVQANVTGIDPNRTDVVTVSTHVHLRPDIEAASLTAPGQVRVDTPVTVHGVMAEVNGDLGARATCRLLVDGAEVDAIAGAWVDAAGSVACQFNTSFATVGARTLTLKVTDVTPRDYDAGNNEASATVNVVQANDFRYMHAWANDYQETTNRGREERRFVSTSGGASEWVREWDRRYHYQDYGAYGYFSAPSSLLTGRIVLTHATDGMVIPTASVNVADLPWGWDSGDGSGCRYGQHVAGMYFQLCTVGGYTDLLAYRSSRDVVYMVDRATASGEPWWWYSSWDNSGTSYQDGSFVALGSTYSAELRHEDDSNTRAGTLEVALQQYDYTYDNWANPSCWSYSWSEGTESGCWRQTYSHRQRYGFSSVSNP